MATVTSARSTTETGVAPPDNRRKILEATMRRHQYRPEALIEVLHKAQELYGYLDPALLREVAARLHVPPSRAYGVATFYHLFVLEPPGEHTCTVCLGTACYVRGGLDLLAAAEAATGLKGVSTRADGKISLRVARCLGACGIAPVVVLDNETVASAGVEQVKTRLQEMLKDAE